MAEEESLALDVYAPYVIGGWKRTVRTDIELGAAVREGMELSPLAEVTVVRMGKQPAEEKVNGKRSEEFHKHLDACAQCRDHPFELCPDGDAILTRGKNLRRPAGW